VIDNRLNFCFLHELRRRGFFILDDGAAFPASAKRHRAAFANHFERGGLLDNTHTHTHTHTHTTSSLGAHGAPRGAPRDHASGAALEARDTCTVGELGEGGGVVVGRDQGGLRHGAGRARKTNEKLRREKLQIMCENHALRACALGGVSFLMHNGAAVDGEAVGTWGTLAAGGGGAWQPHASGDGWGIRGGGGGGGGGNPTAPAPHLEMAQELLEGIFNNSKGKGECWQGGHVLDMPRPAERERERGAPWKLRLPCSWLPGAPQAPPQQQRHHGYQQGGGGGERGWAEGLPYADVYPRERCDIGQPTDRDRCDTRQPTQPPRYEDVYAADRKPPTLGKRARSRTPPPPPQKIIAPSSASPGHLLAAQLPTGIAAAMMEREREKISPVNQIRSCVCVCVCVCV